MKRSLFAALTAGLVALSLLVSGPTVAAGSGPALTTPSTAEPRIGNLMFVEGTLGNVNVPIGTGRRGTTANFTWSGKLPTGLIFMNNGDGLAATLAGMPAVGSAGTYMITVRSVDSKGGRAVQTLDVTVAPIASDVPIVSSVSPNSDSGPEVTISGKNLSGVTAVMFGSTPAPSFEADSAGTSIHAAVPTGVTGTVDVTVSSTAGTSPTSVDDRFTYNAVPQKPVIVRVWPEGLGILATWAPNATTDKVSTYTVTATIVPGFEPGSGTGCQPTAPTTAPGTSSAVLLTTDICAGVPYTLTLAAINPWGTGPPSAPSDTVVPLDAQPPTAPLIRSVLSRPRSLIVDWAPPANDGGNAITQYTLTASRGGTIVSTSSPAGTATHGTITGLTDAARYTVSLVARSAAGTSPPATASGRPSSTKAPAAPSGLQVVPDGTGHVMVTWSPPFDSGSQRLTGYVLNYWTALPGPVCATTTKGSLPKDWSDPRTLLISQPPKCARGFTDVTIDGQRMSAILKGDRLELTSGGGFAIRAGATVVFNHPVVVNLPASTTSRRLVGLIGADYYSVSVRAKSSVGEGPAIEASRSVTPTVRLARNTEILDSSTMEALRSQTVDSSGLGHVLIWPASTTFDPPLAPGLVLIGSSASAAPEGLLVQVQSVSTTSSGDIAVDTAPVSASQAFTTMSFSFSGLPPDTSGGAVQANLAGVRTASASGDPTIPVDWTSDDGDLSIEGQVSFTPSVSIGFSIYCKHYLGYGKHKVCYSWGGSAAASASLTGSLDLTASLQGGDTIDLFTEALGCICFAVGPVPVVIIPLIQVNLVYSGGVSLNATASVSLGGGVTWDSSSGFANNHYAAVGSSGSPTRSVYLQGTIGLQVLFALCLYAILCGNISANANLEADVFLTGPPYFKICPSIAIDVGLMMFLIVWNTSTSTTLATFTPNPPCYTLSTPPVTLSISPANVTVPLGTNVRSFTATRSDGGAPSSTWMLQNPISQGGDTISSSGSLSTCCVGGNRVLILQDTDSTSPVPVAPATATITVGSTPAYDPPSHLALTPIGGPITLFGQIVQVTGARISWTAPVNTGGASISSYIVKVNGVTYTTNVTHLDVPASIILNWVQVQVTAVNANGAASPAATLWRWLAAGHTGAL